MIVPATMDLAAVGNKLDNVACQDELGVNTFSVRSRLLGAIFTPYLFPRRNCEHAGLALYHVDLEFEVPVDCAVQSST